MKKVICALVVLVMCFMLACPALATQFVPSITYKDIPELVTVLDDAGNPAIARILDADGNVVDYIYDFEHCLVVTPLSKARTSELIPEDAEEELLWVYAELKKKNMQIPFEKLGEDKNEDNMVVRDLFDASWLCAEHPEMLAPAGIVIELTFNLGVSANTEVYVMTYKNDQWNNIVSVVNNGDGTVTCVFEDFCPIAFIVPRGSSSGPSQTGDAADLTLWVTLMAVSAVALVAVVALSRRKAVR